NAVSVPTSAIPPNTTCATGSRVISSVSNGHRTTCHSPHPIPPSTRLVPLRLSLTSSEYSISAPPAHPDTVQKSAQREAFEPCPQPTIVCSLRRSRPPVIQSFRGD